MANANPYQARLARKHPVPPGTIADLTGVLWRAITRLEQHMAAVDDTAELCKLTHAISQAGGTYLKAVEVGELEARLTALEDASHATGAN